MRRLRYRDTGVLAAAVAAAVVALAAGCGGGGGGGGSADGTPTQTTRAQVEKMHGLASRSLTQNGTLYAPPMLAGGGSAGAAEVAAAPVPMVGSFLRDVAAVPPGERVARRTARAQGRLSPPPPPVVNPDGSIEPVAPGEPHPDMPYPGPIPSRPSTYFDYYLGLWVEVTETPGETKFLLFEDEGRTKPAGSIVTTWPTDWMTYPQVYKSTYEFTAGYLTGSRGFSENTTNADWSGTSKYETVYPDGWKDSGESSWSGRGGYSWKSLTTAPDGQTVSGRGGSLPNGDSGIHIESSDGMVLDYTYRANGSGHGVISGPHPGLPVTVTWTGFGSFAVRYADGTLETLPGWYGMGGGGGGVPVPLPMPIDGGDGTGDAPVTEPDAGFRPPAPPQA